MFSLYQKCIYYLLTYLFTYFLTYLLYYLLTYLLFYLLACLLACLLTYLNRRYQEQTLLGDTHHLIGKNKALLDNYILKIYRCSLNQGFSRLPPAPVVLFFWNSLMVCCLQLVHFSQYIHQYLVLVFSKTEKIPTKHIFLRDTYFLLFAKDKQQ